MSSTFVYKTYTPPTLLKKCCFCLSVKEGSYIIGYFLSILKMMTFAWMIMKIVSARAVMEDYPDLVTLKLQFANILNYCMAFVQMNHMLFAMGLIRGLRKDIWEHVVIFYQSYWIMLLFGIFVEVIHIAVFGSIYDTETWLMLIPKFTLILAEIYFIFITRRCSQEMKVEAARNEAVTNNA